MILRQRGNCDGHCMSCCDICIYIYIMYRICGGRQIPGKKLETKISKFSNNKALFKTFSLTIVIKETCLYLLGNLIHIVEYVAIHT